MHVCRHTHRHTPSICILQSLQSDSSIFHLLIFIGSFHLPFLNLCLSFSSALFLNLFSPSSFLLCSLYSSLLVPFILRHIISLFSCMSLSEESISNPHFSSIATVMTTSPALTLSLNPLSWSNRKLNSTNTLSTQAAHLYSCFCCHCWCWCCGLFIAKLLKSVFSMMQYTLNVLIKTRHKMTHTPRMFELIQISSEWEGSLIVIHFNAVWEVWLKCFRS